MQTEIKARVLVSADAALLIQKLRAIHGDLMFHQSGGCCDGSQPMCFPQGEFRVGGNDVCIGEIENCPFWMSKDQFEYWQYSELTIGVTPGRGASFSLEIPMGFRFIVHSRLFSEEEFQQLTPLRFAVD